MTLKTLLALVIAGFAPVSVIGQSLVGSLVLRHHHCLEDLYVVDQVGVAECISTQRCLGSAVDSNSFRALVEMINSEAHISLETPSGWVPWIEVYSIDRRGAESKACVIVGQVAVERCARLIRGVLTSHGASDDVVESIWSCR
jgi:hypothetical protein